MPCFKPEFENLGFRKIIPGKNKPGIKTNFDKIMELLLFICKIMQIIPISFKCVIGLIS
jgi:hypothetical protein